MAKAVILAAIIAIAIPLFSLNFLADIYGWYWTIPWLDMPMHFLGGLLTALIFYFAFDKFLGRLDFKEDFYLILILVSGWSALVGVIWEWLEFFYDVLLNAGRLVYTTGSLADSLSDLFFDILGTLAFVVFSRLFYNYKTGKFHQE